MITEDHIEAILHAIRSASVLEARELLRAFAADCRAQGLIDMAKHSSDSLANMAKAIDPDHRVPMGQRAVSVGE